MINAALGFDTFLVLRHGILGNDVQMNNDLACGEASSSKCRAKKIYGSHLGCYFCNDVVAPGDVIIRKNNNHFEFIVFNYNFN